MINTSSMIVLIYSFTLWLGVYLLRRNWQKPVMRYAGLGLITYAVGMVLVTVLPRTDLHLPVTILPLICWALAVINYRQTEISSDQQFNRTRRPRALIVAATISFSGGLALLVIPQALLRTDLVLLLIGVDLLILGYSIAVLDADDEGEALLPDALRSLVLTAAGGLVFGGQIVLVMAIQGTTDALQFLLLSTLTIIIIIPALLPWLQQALDAWLLADSPQLQQERSQLQAVYEALSRRADSLDALTLDEAEFTRLTRRALGHLGDFERLATSPLIHLPVISQRLADQQRPESTLGRITELRAILIESIERLRPPGAEAFGTGDEWRYYNALYFPYVLGLKPYRRYPADEDLDDTTRTALAWFQAQVPERTLYNWQNKAAQLIARDLREQLPVSG